MNTRENKINLESLQVDLEKNLDEIVWSPTTSKLNHDDKLQLMILFFRVHDLLLISLDMTSKNMQLISKWLVTESYSSQRIFSRLIAGLNFNLEKYKLQKQFVAMLQKMEREKNKLKDTEVLNFMQDNLLSINNNLFLFFTFELFTSSREDLLSLQKSFQLFFSKEAAINAKKEAELVSTKDNKFIIKSLKRKSSGMDSPPNDSKAKNIKVTLMLGSKPFETNDEEYTKACSAIYRGASECPSRSKSLDAIADFIQRKRQKVTSPVKFSALKPSTSFGEFLDQNNLCNPLRLK